MIDLAAFAKALLLGRTPRENEKQWWRSKTAWFNLLVAIFLVLEYNIESIKAAFPLQMKDQFVVALPFINLFLRFISSKGISFRPRLPGTEEST